MTVQLGYCTNVHAGVELEDTIRNLERHALAVRQSFCGARPMGIGLWFAARAAWELRDPARLRQLAGWLQTNQLIPFTLNGFPYGDFHQEVVKYDVYLPDWSDPRRRDYTLDLIHALDGLLPVGMAGSISTLPVAWGRPRPSAGQLMQAARHLVEIAQQLARLQAATGRLIYVCLEPEPGCVLQQSEDVVHFFEDYLLATGAEHHVRQHLRVCHDVCHTAVMFEDQATALRRYAAAGIQVGKVQISSAVEVDFTQLAPTARRLAARELASFVERRYLHQTSVRPADSTSARFFDDLPEALADAQQRQHEPWSGCWRVHFHVPIYLTALHNVRTTQADIRQAFAQLASQENVQHYEVETYAWNVLPEPLRHSTLAAGIAGEMQFAADALTRCGLLEIP